MAKPVRQKTPKGSRTSESAPRDTIGKYSNRWPLGLTNVLFVVDPRFANIQTDPRFRLPSRKNTHVTIDKRFAHMLRDERFSSTAKVDRYGRPLPKDSGRKELERLYRVEDEAEDDAVASDEEVKRELKRVEGYLDPTRDGGFSESSSEESTSDEEDEGAAEADEDYVTEDADGNGDGGIAPVGEVSSRLAIVNLDWDNIRATDLMAVFASFVPDPGSLLNVSVYPSDFGKERMEREETEGPPKEIFARKVAREPGPIDSESESDEDAQAEEEEDERIKKSLLKEDQGEDFDSAKLRQYQLERLRYYYAVLTCASTSVAEVVYNAVDGTEYLTTANFFDLRFIPDDMDFSNDKPRDECDRIPDGYRPNEFVTDALQHSKVKLTWDADDKTRKEIQRRAFSGSRAEIDENDLKAYLGSDTSGDEGPEPILVDHTLNNRGAPDPNPTSFLAAPKLNNKEAERQKMRALLGLGAESVSRSKSKVSNGPTGDMQITFSSGLSSNPKSGSIFENEPEVEETTAEKYVRKEKERKARRKEKMKAARNGSSATTTDEASKHTETVEDEPEDLGFDDPFFTAPEDDRAAATTLRREQKRHKRAERAAAEAAASAQRAELELLMIDDDATNQHGDPVSRSKVNHFNINEIAKAEKALKKKKKGKLSAREKSALEAKEKDDFKMDVSDPRFGAVFERPEFAVDPSNPRFKGTQGMKALLEEGRRKRAREEGEEGTDAEGVAVGRRTGKKIRSEESNEDAERSREKRGKSSEEDLRDLVERVKGKVGDRASTEATNSLASWRCIHAQGCPIAERHPPNEELNSCFFRRPTPARKYTKPIPEHRNNTPTNETVPESIPPHRERSPPRNNSAAHPTLTPSSSPPAHRFSTTAPPTTPPPPIPSLFSSPHFTPHSYITHLPIPAFRARQRVGSRSQNLLRYHKLHLAVPSHIAKTSSDSAGEGRRAGGREDGKTRCERRYGVGWVVGTGECEVW